MTHTEALKIFDSMLPAAQVRVKLAVVVALKARSVELFNADKAGKQAIVEAEMTKAIQDNM